MKQRGFSWFACATLVVTLVAPVSSFAQQPGICDRTPAVQEAIRGYFLAISHPGVHADINATPCLGFTPERLAGVVALDLSQQELTSLKAGDFDQMPNLAVILLYENRLQSLPPRLFDGLSRLLWLDLTDNNISLLPEGMFDGLTSLGVLSLGGNRLSSLPAGLFHELTSLTALILSGNRLSSLPPGSFRGLPLQVLHLYGNQFQRLPAGIFTGMAGSGLNTRRASELLAELRLGFQVGEDEAYPGLHFALNPANASRQHSFSVSLEVSESPRQAMVRVEEGVPSPTELTLMINGKPQVLDMPVGADRATHSLPIERAVVVLKAGMIGDPAIVRGFTGVDFRVARQEAMLESARKVSIRASATSVTEGRTATFTLTLDAGPGVPSAGLEVTVDVSGDGARTSSRGMRQVTIPAGSRTTTFTVNARPEDQLHQGDQTMTATVRSGNDAAAGTPSSARVTVREDADPVIEEAVSEVEGVSEAGETKVLPRTEVVLRGRASDVNTDQSLTTAWSGPLEVTLTPVAGQTSEVIFTAPAMLGHYTFTFSADDDGVGTGDVPITREVVVKVVSGRGVSIRASSSSLVLEDEVEVIEFEVRASMASTTPLIVNVTLSEEGGTFDLEDGARTVTIAANETTRRFTVPIADDNRHQGNGALRAEVMAGTGYVAVAPAHARVRILDDDSLLDMNADGAVNAHDALILYYAWAFRKVLGNGR